MAGSNKVAINALRRKILGNEAASSPLTEVEGLLRKSHPSLEVAVTSVECSNNHLKELLIASKNPKIHRKDSGPLDSMRFIIDCELNYSVYVLYELYAEGKLSSSLEIETLDVLDQMSNEQLSVCQGVCDYSLYNVVCKDIVPLSLPHDSVRHSNCSRIFSVLNRKSDSICNSCLSLKFYLTRRKTTLSLMTTPDRKRRQDVSSTVPFDFLSPFSKTQRLKNMRRKIYSLHRKLSSGNCSSIELEDEQNVEMTKLVKGIFESDVGVEALEKIYEEADSTFDGRGEELRSVWSEDVEMFYCDQKQNRNGKRGNRWSPITIRLALAVLSRSPSAFHALRNLGILNLPCGRTLKGCMYQHATEPGINESSIRESSGKYSSHIEEKVRLGLLPPLKEGILIWDETKVQSKIIWNSSNSSITGYAMSSSEMASLHDIYDGINEEDECQKTEYMLQFMWRDLSSSYDVIGPYFTLSGSIEAQHLHSIVMDVLLVFNKFHFCVRSLLCDGASSNLSLLKELCCYSKDSDNISPFFISPFDNRKIFLIICPSHQLKNMIAALYSSRESGTKDFISVAGVHFGWQTLEDVYRSDSMRAKMGKSRRVPKLKYSYIVRDSWTRLNVLPAKIMQQPYMIAAIEEMAEGRPEEQLQHKAALEYLTACSLLFEKGTLSHDRVGSTSSTVLKNLDSGFNYFFTWKKHLTEKGKNVRAPTQSCFIAWQTWDLLEIMYRGFKGLCETFVTEHPGYYIIPVRVTGSAIETVFSSLKYISGSNLSSINYAASLSALVTQRETYGSSNCKDDYRNEPLNL